MASCCSGMKLIPDRGRVRRVQPLETFTMTSERNVQVPLKCHTFSAKAVLFDMDGVLTINGHLHVQAWQRFAWENLALEVAEDDPRIHGGRNEDILVALTGQPATPDVLHACQTTKEGHYRNLARGRLHPVPGLHRYLDWLAGRGIPCALVTSADSVNLAFVLGELGLAERFSIKIAAEDVQRGKPDPEPYLLAAARIGVDPALCLVHEDAPAGVRSALAAGCSVVALSTTLSAPVLMAAGARVCMPDFTAWMARIGVASSE